MMDIAIIQIFVFLISALIFAASLIGLSGDGEVDGSMAFMLIISAAVCYFTNPL